MAEIKAFNALRYTQRAGCPSELVCPPYDIISEGEREDYLAKNPHNIIRLELPREGADPYSAAGQTLASWLEDNTLACDEKPGLYIYEEEFTAHSVRRRVKGLCCRVRLEPFSKGVVLPHEETLSKAKTDRLNLMKATGCNFSSIYSLYFDEQKQIAPAIERLSSGKPDVCIATADGIIHRVWCVYDPAEIAAVEAAFDGKSLYIADGHHRYETALNYREHLKESGVCTDENHAANYCMMTLVGMEHEGLVVFPTHRIVRALDGFNAQEILDGCAKYFDIREIHYADIETSLQAEYDAGRKAFVFYCGKKYHLLILQSLGVMDEILPGTSDIYRWLDVNVLHSLVLERLMHIDKENMANQKNLIYTRDIVEAVAAVDNGEANCAFIINATRVDEIAGVAGAGEKMPQKSTYFYPKLITGHLMNKIL